MNIVNIVIIAIILVIIYIVLSKTILKTNIVYDKILDANDPNPDYSTGGSGGFLTSASVKQNVIPSGTLDDNFTSNFMISVWFYIDNWGSQIGEEKNILFFGSSHQDITPTTFKTTSMPGISNVQCITPDPSVTNKRFSISLDKFDNNLFIDVKTFQTDDCNSDGDQSNKLYTRYKVENIPIQKWNCLTISVDTLLMDVYLDGKLYSSFILPSTFDNNETQNPDGNHIYLGNLVESSVGQSGNDVNIGFQGFITRIRFEPNAINTQEALNIYKAGINKSLVSSIFNKYSLKVSFLEYNKEKGSFSI